MPLMLNDSLNINKDSKNESLEAQKPVNKGGRSISGLSKITDGTIVCDEQIKEYICEIIESEGLFYGYYKITVILRPRR